MIRIIDYKAGNAPSVLNAINRLASRGEPLSFGLGGGSGGCQYVADFARSAQDLDDVTHIILPGVGSAKATMISLREMELISVLEDKVLRNGVPFLGICVGMQILFEHSEEGDTNCLGWLKGKVVKFDSSKVRVPQMGWNKVWDDYFYFVNSYYAKPKTKAMCGGLPIITARLPPPSAEKTFTERSFISKKAARQDFFA